MAGSLSLSAGGNLTPSSFVKISGGDRTVVLCGAGDPIIGITKEWTRFPPWENLNDGYVAILGESVAVYTYDKDTEAYLEVNGTVAAGDYLKSDGSGFGVTASSDGDQYGAQALEAGVAGSIIKVLMVKGFRGA